MVWYLPHHRKPHNKNNSQCHTSPFSHDLQCLLPPPAMVCNTPAKNKHNTNTYSHHTMLLIDSVINTRSNPALISRQLFDITAICLILTAIPHSSSAHGWQHYLPTNINTTTSILYHCQYLQFPASNSPCMAQQATSPAYTQHYRLYCVEKSLYSWSFQFGTGSCYS